jgi:hypothetical protein
MNKHIKTTLLSMASVLLVTAAVVQSGLAVADRDRLEREIREEGREEVRQNDRLEGEIREEGREEMRQEGRQEGRKLDRRL